MAVLCTVMIHGKNLANGIVSGKYFWFYISMALLSVVAVPAAIARRREKVRFRLPDLLIFVFCLSVVGLTFHHTGRLTNKCLLLSCLLAFYFYLRIFFSGDNKLIRCMVVVFFMLTGLMEAVWGLCQLYGFAHSQHHLFKITGSFFNPGPYSGWLAVVFPVAFWHAASLFTDKVKEKSDFCHLHIRTVFVFLKTVFPKWVKILTGFLTALCIVLILPAAMSRAAWLAVLGGCAFTGILYGLQNRKITDCCKKYRKHMIGFSFVALILFAIAMTGLFLLKKDSASGRAFTWKISVQTVIEHPMGVGLGNFGGAYGGAQAAYFASGTGAEWEKHVAEGVEYAFNEYLQICIEAGIIPFMIFIAFIVYTLSWGIRKRNYIPVGALVSLLIFASMSYPFNVLPFVIAFVFLSALCVSDNTGKLETKRFYPGFAVWTFIVIAPAAIALCGYTSYPAYEAYKQWRTTQTLYGVGLYREAAEEYARQYPYLQDEIKFLFEYAQSLSKSEQYDKSNEILRQAMQISCDPMLYNVMGRNCQALKQYELAEQCLKKSINLVPNRLYPHYLLAKLYHEMGLKDKAEAETNIVFTQPPKVESMAVEEMKNELVKLIEN
jgi:hypothetical protein